MSYFSWCEVLKKCLDARGLAAAVHLHFGPPGTACDRQRSSERSQGEDKFEISQANAFCHGFGDAKWKPISF